MRSIWTLLCCVVLGAALTACKSSAPAPAEDEAAAEAAQPAEEAAATEEAAAPGAAPAAEKPADIPAPPDVAAPPENAERSESGLAWTVLEKGTGDNHPKEWDVVTVNYTGWTTDGKMFDSSV